MTDLRDHVELTAFVDALSADGPHPALADRMRVFGRFVGSWDLVVTMHEEDGSARQLEGEWYFAYALEGRAIADVWICPRRSLPASERARGEAGITVRFPDPDPQSDRWRSTWIGPAYGLVYPFVGRPVGDDIVLTGEFDPGVTTRWMFTDITPTTFEWWNHTAPTGTNDWRLHQHFEATRR